MSIPNNLTDRNSSTYEYKGKDTVPPHRLRSALPVPIVRGARIFDSTSTGSSEDISKAHLHSHTLAQCRTRMPSPHAAEALQLKSETLLHRLQAMSETAALPAPSDHSPRAAAAFVRQDGNATTSGYRRQWPAYRNIQTTKVSGRSADRGSRQAEQRLSQNRDLLKPIAVHRASVPEYSDPFREGSSLRPRLSQLLPADNGGKPNEASGHGELTGDGDDLENSRNAPEIGEKRAKVDAGLTMYHRYTAHRTPPSASAMDLQPLSTLHAPLSAARANINTKSTLSELASADAVAPHVLHQDTSCSSGFHSNQEATINSAANMAHPTVRGDGCLKQSGRPCSLPRLGLFHPPLESPHRQSQETTCRLVSSHHLLSASSHLHSNLLDHLTNSESQVLPRLGNREGESSIVKLETCPTGGPLEPTTTHDTIDQRCRRSEMARREKGLDTPLANHLATGISSNPYNGCNSMEDAGLESPVSCDEDRRSDWLSDEEEYETPMTSPSHSPIKLNFSVKKRSRILQLDGGDEVDEFDSATGRAKVEDELRELFANSSGSIIGLDGHSSSLVTSDEDSDEFESNREDDLTTPLVPASPAKGAGAFPFPLQLSLSSRNPLTKRSSLRYPSALLRHCERNATPRQQRLMALGTQAPDRFIPSRAATPTKEAFLLSSPRPKKASTRSTALVLNSSGMPEDPFAPTPIRSLRMAEQYATIQNPPPVPRSVGIVPTRVRDAQEPPIQRATSTGTVWTVGGTVVTEGVASVTNGRGGRVTSGTSGAPHYAADFLRRRSRLSDDELMHGKRLAFAMDLDPGARMMRSSPVSSSSSVSPESKRVWKDGGWMVEGEVSPTKPKAKKEKDVPIIPFRVLDAPALRDDYYCSLLAYSSTVECLAVGLGPHVYLWAENRGTTNIPDSLTAPLGAAHVTSVSFSSREGGSAILAIGRADGRITLWSPLDRDPRFDSEQPAPVSCICFRPNTVRRQSLREPTATVATEELLVGDEAGYVYYYSIEWPDQEQRDLFDWHGSMTLLARINCHSQQVCGIAWSPDGEHFATGGNDNQLFLFESKKVLRPSPGPRRATTASPIYVRSGSGSSSNTTAVPGQGEVLSITPGQEKHVFALNAAVKAIAFAPWQSTLLAAGGGSNDRCIHFFHALSGAALATIDCHAQVTSLVWSEKRKEIAATFGFAQPEHAFRVAVFTWPGCGMVVGIPWYGEERALYSVAYPRGPSSGHSTLTGRGRGGRSRGVDATAGRADAEGRPWYGRRTREEGCLVVATSDASIKFHEIWAERSERRSVSGILGGSQILEGECSAEVERSAEIR